MMLFSRPVRGLLPQMNREPINVNNDNLHYEALEVCQKMIMAKVLKKLLLDLLQELQ